MDLFINDISWWRISLFNFINSWLPAVFAFLIGMIFSKIVDRRRQREQLKRRLLEIFIPVFNTGQTISEQVIKETIAGLLVTLNTYSQVYPKVFKNDAVISLREVLKDGAFSDGQVTDHFKDPTNVIELIRRL